jgi:hypothetical protein
MKQARKPPVTPRNHACPECGVGIGAHCKWQGKGTGNHPARVAVAYRDTVPLQKRKGRRRGPTSERPDFDPVLMVGGPRDGQVVSPKYVGRWIYFLADRGRKDTYELTGGMRPLTAKYVGVQA